MTEQSGRSRAIMMARLEPTKPAPPVIAIRFVIKSVKRRYHASRFITRRTLAEVTGACACYNGFVDVIQVFGGGGCS